MSNFILLDEAIVTEAPETVEVTQAPERPFLTTPLNDYTVSEGLLLLLVICAFFAAVLKILKGVF